MDEKYFKQSDAIDMAIDRMRGHITTMEQRALIASNFLWPGYRDISKLVDAILYGPDCEYKDIFGEGKDETDDM